MTRVKRTYRTVVADSHNLFRRGLATLITAEADMQVVAEVTSASSALALFPDGYAENAEIPAIDLLVMEMGLVAADTEAMKQLRQLAPKTAVLFLAPAESPECLEVMVASGARAYMVKSTPPAQLVSRIRQVVTAEEGDPQGLSPQAPDLQALAQTERSYPRTSPLTSREQEVMTLLAEGRTVREVAGELGLSIKTIEAHKLNLMRKLDIHNRASLVDYAVRSGFVTAQPVAS